MENQTLDPRQHFVTATAIIAKKGEDGVPRFLIAKRAPYEKAFPNKWYIPGGKLVRSEYEHLPPRPYKPNQAVATQWYNMIDWLLRKEVKEEVNVEIRDPKYLTDVVFIRPDGYPVIVLSFWCWYVSGEPKPGKDITDVAWVTAAEAKQYDMIEGDPEEIEDVEKMISGS